MAEFLLAAIALCSGGARDDAGTSGADRSYRLAWPTAAPPLLLASRCCLSPAREGLT